MSAHKFEVKNTTAEAITDLAINMPDGKIDAGATVDLLTINPIGRVYSDSSLLDHFEAGTLIRVISGADLSVDDSVESLKETHLRHGSGATVPGVNEDAAAGYNVLSDYLRTTDLSVYKCVDNTVGAAVWKKITA